MPAVANRCAGGVSVSGWRQELRRLLGKGAFIVGVGNALKGDDAFGPEVIRRINYQKKLDAGTVPENFLSKLERDGPKAILLIDAVDFGGRPGEIRLFAAEEAENPNISTHTLSLRHFAHFFGGCEVRLLGVQPETNEFGAGLSASMAKAVEEVVEAINADAAVAERKRGRQQKCNQI